MITFGPEGYGVEQEMVDFGDKHPNATSQQLYNYFESITPELEIVDDDE